MADTVKRSERLLSAIKFITETVHIIITQVDPDAIGAAFALEYILRNLGKDSKIFYCGAIGHPQNRSIVNKYNLSRRMKPIQKMELSENIPTALVDSSSIDDARLGSFRGKIHPVIIVDHHRGNGHTESEKTFFDIEDAGATCTLLIEIMSELGMKFTDENRIIALLLALGIYTDTKALVSAGSRDRDAYGKVTKFITPMEMSELIKYDLPESHYTHLLTALTKIQRSGPRLVTGLGGISAENGDDLSTIADWLIRMEGVTLAVVWGRIGTNVRMSVRNHDLATPLDEFLKKRFGENAGAKLSPNGIGEGGGLITLELGFLLTAKTENDIDAVINEALSDLFFKD